MDLIEKHKDKLRDKIDKVFIDFEKELLADAKTDIEVLYQYRMYHTILFTVGIGNDNPVKTAPLLHYFDELKKDLTYRLNNKMDELKSLQKAEFERKAREAKAAELAEKRKAAKEAAELKEAEEYKQHLADLDRKKKSYEKLKKAGKV